MIVSEMVWGAIAMIVSLIDFWCAIAMIVSEMFWGAIAMIVSLVDFWCAIAMIVDWRLV